MNIIENDIPKGQYNKYNELVKKVDKYLLAERVAIEVKALHKVFKENDENFALYLEIGRQEIKYSHQEEQEILDIAEKILKKKYNIIIHTRNPLKIEVLTNRK